MKLPAIDPKAITPRIGITAYPEKFRGPVLGRERRALGDVAGIKSFGVNLTTIPPGGWSAQRHWHAREDEFIFIVEGELVLVTDAGEQILGPGMAAGFPANSRRRPSFDQPLRQAGDLSRDRRARSAGSRGSIPTST